MAHIHKIGIQNFRIFKDYSECEIAPITILTGPNNSGKSTFIRALKLLEESAKLSGFYNLLPNNTETEYFSNSSLFSINEDANSQKLLFSLNIENSGSNQIVLPEFFQIRLEFMRGINKSSDLILCSIQVEDLKSGKEFIKYFSGLHEIGLKESVDHFSISDEFEKREREAIELEIEIIKSIAEIFIQKIIYLPTSRISQQREFNRRDTTFLSNKLFSIEDGDLKIFNSSQNENLTGEFRISYQPYLIEKSAKEFVFTNDKINSVFSLGQHILFLPNNHLGNYELLLHTYDDKLVNVADLGYGVSNLITMLLSIDIASAEYQGTQFSDIRLRGEKASRKVLSKVHKDSEKLILIEEPELNLHPNFQAKLADVFALAHKKMGIRFIIETHSEYLIRKLQTLVAEKIISADDVSLNYIYNHDKAKRPAGKQQVHNIKIKEDGRLSEAFGSGFFDEADNLAMDLLSIKSMN